MVCGRIGFLKKREESETLKEILNKEKTKRHKMTVELNKDRDKHFIGDAKIILDEDIFNKIMALAEQRLMDN